jgi:hypothetical protein
MASWNERTPHNIIDYTEKPGMNPNPLLLALALAIPFWLFVCGIATLIIYNCR